jgi:hypothetical protein
MKLQLNIKLTLLLSLLGVAGTWISCNKDDNSGNNSSKTELVNFGPTGAEHGDTVRFFGRNLDKVTEIDFTGANVMSNQFKQQDKEHIMVVVPDAAQEGLVTLKSPTGDVVSKTRFNLEVLPVITSMTKEARPGENVTIKGKYLDWVTAITFSVNKPATTIVSKKLDELVVKVPMDAQSGKIIIYYGGTKSSSYETDSTVKVTLPAITSMTPNPVLHANNLTIAGTNLDLATKITFAGVSTPVTSFVSQSATQIVVKVPGGTQKGKIVLTAPSGVNVESSQDLDVVLPAITSIAPNPIATGSDLTITGTNLNLVTAVSFTGVAAPVTTFVSQSATQIVVTVPAGTLKGKVVCSVLNSTLKAESADLLQILGGLPNLPDFTFAIYTDALQNGYQDWSYTDTHDFNSSVNVRQGSKSIRAVYAAGGYQGLTFHNPGTAPTTSGYTKLEFSVYGEAGTGGKKLNVVINGNYSSPPQVTVLEGEWSTFSLDFSTMGSPASIGEIVLQSAGWGGTIHVDHVGFR